MILSTLKRVKYGIFGLMRLSIDFFYDFCVCVSYSNFVFSMNDREARFAAITAQIHNIEKGLSLPNPRPGFGKANLEALFGNLHFYVARFGTDALVGRAQAVLRAYVRFNDACGCTTYPQQKNIAWLQALDAPQCKGGTTLITRREMQQISEAVPAAFFLSRHSIRNFSTEPVDLAKVVNAIRIAQKSPSVCNRQSGYVYILTDKNEIAEALALQGGADGFSQTIPLLLVLTSRNRNFWIGERNERWVDGGLFAMSVIYGLHREGLGSCALNWCKSAVQDIRFKRRMRIPPDRSILFLLAVGNVPEELRVACSEKRSPEDMYELR